MITFENNVQFSDILVDDTFDDKLDRLVYLRGRIDKLLGASLSPVTMMLEIMPALKLVFS